MITCQVRFSYLNCFEPKETPSGDMKYSASCLIPKDDEKGVAEIKAAINKAVQAGIDNNKFSKAQVNGLRLPLRDGDEEFDNGNRGVEYKGHYFINCSSKNKPGVVDSQAKPLFDAEAFFSGCYGRADVGFFPYNQAGNRGIGVGLNNLMMTKEGERLDGRQKAEDAFANFAAEGETSGDLE